MKWYFAVNEHGLRYAWDQLQVTVNSALRNTQLKPFCLVDHGDKPAEVEARIAALAQAGVTIIEHRASLWPIVRAKHKLNSDTFSGHWLRCDIPMLDLSDEIVLYTDIDVMFRRNPEPFSQRPEFLACAPEHHQDDWSYFNSGVMLMNLTGLRATREALVRHVEDQIVNMAPHDDQGALNSVYHGRYDRLDLRYNWKPYWGFKDEATILHFHGPKPGVIHHYQMEDGDPLRFGAALYSIYRRNPEGYAKYMIEAGSYRRSF
ncbi:glycosyltransferase [Methylobacterium frigidaeris]|uniref:Glycosyltransferase n=1 Tax=Methylobacterium frigidaeris TaxID=2038277 RepID=A0AA37HHN3_9HYPH|nr:glycosyltransferase [Methylobacterium frigidaeris]PIK74030.1 hypothetical protein CS379_04820 [Methylobacterium frigidaeris]GJD66297.1 hypothetical protein MPEAHAMD_6494 [Methylobacterium frigidaeris]